MACFNTWSHNRYMEEQEFLNLKEEMIQKELEKRKQDALTKLESFISPALSLYFGKILAEAVREGNDDAEIILNSCSLSQAELNALRDDDDGIYEELMAENNFEDPYDDDYRYIYDR